MIQFLYLFKKEKTVLAEMVYDTGEIIWTVVLSVMSLALLGLFILTVVGVVQHKPNGTAELLTVTYAIVLLAIVLASSAYGIFYVPAQRAEGLAITRDLEKQGFCVDSVSTHDKTALLCSSNGSLYEVKVIKQGGQWVARNGSQRLNQEPTTTSTTTKPLKPSDLDTEPD